MLHNLILYCATLALIYSTINVSAQQIPAPAPALPPATSSSTRVPNVDWGPSNELFIISDAKIERQKKMTSAAVPYEITVLTFIVEITGQKNVFVPIFAGYCYDADNIQDICLC